MKIGTSVVLLFFTCTVGFVRCVDYLSPVICSNDEEANSCFQALQATDRRRFLNGEIVEDKPNLMATRLDGSKFTMFSHNIDCAMVDDQMYQSYDECGDCNVNQDECQKKLSSSEQQAAEEAEENGYD